MRQSSSDLATLEIMANQETPNMISEDEWRQRLTPEQYRILREKGTDRPFEGEYTHPIFEGSFRCAGCGTELFSSETQFDSGCGWPSFTAPVNPDNVALTQDRSHNMVRIEVTCRSCGGHLGPVFDDGPAPTGQRFCINSTSIDLDSSV
jgi:peptide-methionine (R)-S-oxide reductase